MTHIKMINRNAQVSIRIYLRFDNLEVIIMITAKNCRPLELYTVWLTTWIDV